ncbi:hypothetical protein [Neobacillus niacini]|uniref:hypothetical protein n=1 Tax=Neobacillus niacini TaxID=86668 RepID=UPI001C8EF983|nr:hypothetical protein [Neobacillus niacini]MBY0145108.1 hypothetical protein [Neobacillus niacini]
MDLIKQIIEITKKGINGPEEIIMLIVASVIFIYSLFIKFHKIISLNEFDRLFLPKNERSIQQVIVKITEYITFSLLYLVSGLALSIIVSLLHNIFGIWIFILTSAIFILSLIPIMLRVATIELFGRERAEGFNWFIRFHEKKVVKHSFNINYYATFPFYASLFYYFLYENVKLIGIGVLILFSFPMLILYLYRSYRNKSIHGYICEIISEEDFNRGKVVIHYALDKDRIIFRKPNDNEQKEIFLYDRSSDKHFKFTKENSQ